MYTIKEVRMSFLSENIARARGRKDGKSITLTTAEAYEIGERQNWLCAITSKPLEFKRGGTYYGGKWCNPLACSIDRLDNKQGYHKDNVHLVTWAANLARGNTNLVEFKQYLGL